MRYKLSQIATIVGGSLRGKDSEVTSVATDSRSMVSPEAFFVAMRGINHDGHNYIETMIQRGVCGFLVETMPQGISTQNSGFVVVNNSLEALQRLAAYHRAQYHGPVVAITGSNGKTIVKEWIAQLWLAENGKLLRSPGSYNSQLGVALSLLLIEGDESLVVIEAGISAPGQMERLHKMVAPTIGIFTNLGTAHGENFENQEQKRSEKELLFKGCSTVIRNQSEGSVEQQNLGSVLALYDLLSLSHSPVEILQPVAMRLEVEQGFLGSTIVNDSYNCDITSLVHAIEYAASLPAKRRVVVLSDIFNFTDYSLLTDIINRSGIDIFIGVGDSLSSNANGFTVTSKFYHTTEQLLSELDLQDFANAVVLVKGARNFGFESVSAALESRTHTTVLEVSLAALSENLNYYRSLLPTTCSLVAMIKAQAYGAGGVQVARLMERQGVELLAVAYADEGVELRAAGIGSRIVVLNAASGSYAQMVEHNLEPEIYSKLSLEDYIRTVRACGLKGLPIHLKIDSGMHRLGFMEPQIDDLIKVLRSTDVVSVSTIFSHLAASEDGAEDDFTSSQIALFDRLSLRIMKALPNTKIRRHICNSAAIERFPQAHYDMVRLGIGLYGFGSDKVQIVSRLTTRIVQIKEITPPETVGYNRRGQLNGTTRIGILALGYADGLSRALGCGVGKFLVGDKLCPTIGNICMDTTIVDLSSCHEVTVGQSVVIFGENPTAEQLAKASGTICYEILTSVSSRIKRIYVSQ
ncbi:MAG: alanine racemase [Mucinivorans sp.]